MRKLWLGGAIVLLVHSVVTWGAFLRKHELHRPSAPTEISQPQYAAYWRFLTSARRMVPEGATYTVKAANGVDEMDLFALALDVLPRAKAMPSSYLSHPLPDGDRAKYVLVFGSAQCPGDATVMRPANGGSVCIREIAP